MIQKTQRKQNS